MTADPPQHVPSDQNPIGIVGGMGPSAGFDLAQRIVENTVADCDQDHLPVVIVSRPGTITDRTEYVLGQTSKNPAEGIARAVRQLELSNARYIGIPCCTAHCPVILDEVSRQTSFDSIVHLTQTVVEFVRREFPMIRRIGLLCTLGCYEGRAFHGPFGEAGLELLSPNIQQRHRVHEAIYDSGFGVKSTSLFADAARLVFLDAIDGLISTGAEAIVLGCTELGLTVREDEYRGVPVINPTTVLARELIRLAAPDKLTQRERPRNGNNSRCNRILHDRTGDSSPSYA